MGNVAVDAINSVLPLSSDSMFFLVLILLCE
jgi:hypothetical protein